MTRRMPRGVLIGMGIAVVGVLALVIWRGVGSRDPANLVVGDCFDVPTAAQRIDDLEGRACSGPHGGEVFHIFDAPGASASYPSDTDWEGLIYPVCDPVFETYTGIPVADHMDIGYQYLVPTADRWAAGNRRVTCFISSLDGSPLARSFRAAP
jgi:hypothetical protein